MITEITGDRKEKMLEVILIVVVKCLVPRVKTNERNQLEPESCKEMELDSGPWRVRQT